MELLCTKMGERGNAQEDPFDVLCRLIRERDRAMMLLALDRLKEVQHIW